MMEQVRLCAVWPIENWLGSSLNQIQGWTTVRESYSRALEQVPLVSTTCDAWTHGWSGSSLHAKSAGLEFRNLNFKCACAKQVVPYSFKRLQLLHEKFTFVSNWTEIRNILFRFISGPQTAFHLASAVKSHLTAHCILVLCHLIDLCLHLFIYFLRVYLYSRRLSL